MDGFSTFDTTHVTWLISIGLFLIISIYFYRYLSNKNRRLYQRVIFWVLLMLELAKQLYLLKTNQYSYWSPPLHLCGLGIFIAGWHAYTPGRTTATLLYALTLPGAAIALLFPGWTNDPVGGFLHIHSFVFHALLIAFVCSLIVTKQLELYRHDLWRAAVFLLITIPPIYLYNAYFKTNFMFLNRPVKGTPLQWLFDAFGASGYLVSLTGVIVILWILLYLPIKRRELKG